MKKALAALGLLAATAGTAYAAKLKVYEGAWSEVTESDLAVHPLKDEAYTESWFFMVKGDDGTWLFVHYGISNLQPMSDFDGVIETTIIYQNKVTFVKDNIKKANVKYAQQGLDLAIGKNTLKASAGTYQVKIEQEGVSLTLDVKPTVAGIKPARTVYPKGEYYELDIAAPRAAVTGTLNLKGKTIAVKGDGYFDHSLQNFPAHKMADRLYSFRGFKGEDGLNLLTFTVPKDLGGVDMPALVITKGDKVIAKSTSVTISGSKYAEDEDNDYSYPTEWNIDAKDGETPISGSITLKTKVMEQNAADDFSFFERTLIKAFVANPMLYRYVGTFDLTIGGKAPAKVQGEGVAEVVILRE